MDRDIAAWQAEIDRLRAELAKYRLDMNALTQELERRLNAVIALCDSYRPYTEAWYYTKQVRAAATGETT